MGRVAAQSGAEDAIAVLVAALRDTDPKTRRNAAIALGHVRAGGVEDALMGAWEADTRPEMRRTLAASLGKVGTPRALAILEGASRAADAELARIAQRSAMMIARTASRVAGPAPRIDASRPASQPLAVMALSRTGLEDLLAEEMARITSVKQVRVVGPGRVQAQLYGPMQALFEARTMLAFHFPLEFERVRDGDAGRRDRPSGLERHRPSCMVHVDPGPGPLSDRLGRGRAHAQSHVDAVSVLARRSPYRRNDPTASIWSGRPCR